MNKRDRFEAFTVTVARKMIERDPTIRAAILTSDETPILTSPTCRVRLFEKIGEAEAFLRARRDTLLDGGWTHTKGTLKNGLLVFEKGDETRAVSIDKRRN